MHRIRRAANAARPVAADVISNCQREKRLQYSLPVPLLGPGSMTLVSRMLCIRWAANAARPVDVDNKAAFCRKQQGYRSACFYYRFPRVTAGNRLQQNPILFRCRVQGQ